MPVKNCIRNPTITHDTTQKAINMKWILITLAFMLAMTGCSEQKDEERMIGQWTQLNTNGVATMRASIAKIDDGYSIEITLPIPNQAPVVVKKTGRFENGALLVIGLEKIQIDKNSGHLRIGVNEFELVK